MPSTAFIQDCAIEGIPNRPPRVLYIQDYDCVENVPEYKQLSLFAKYKLAFNVIAIAFYGNYIGRTIINYHLRWSLFIAKHLPYLALWNFGMRNVFVDMFKESPSDGTTPKPNSEYYKPQPAQPWYKVVLSFLW